MDNEVKSEKQILAQSIDIYDGNEGDGEQQNKKTSNKNEDYFFQQREQRNFSNISQGYDEIQSMPKKKACLNKRVPDPELDSVIEFEELQD